MKYYTSADLKAILKKFGDKMDELSKEVESAEKDDTTALNIHTGFCNGIRKAKEELKLICDSELKE